MADELAASEAIATPAQNTNILKVRLNMFPPMRNRFLLAYGRTGCKLTLARRETEGSHDAVRTGAPRPRRTKTRARFLGRRRIRALLSTTAPARSSLPAGKRSPTPTRNRRSTQKRRQGETWFGIKQSATARPRSW